MGKAKKKRNPGWFKRGPDARRSSYRFTTSDCRVGYLVAAIRHPELREWLRMRIRCFYHRKEKAHGQRPQEEDRPRPHDGDGGGDGPAAATDRHDAR